MANDSPKWMRYTGLALTILPCLALVMSAGMKLSHAPKIVESFTKFGFPEPLLAVIGVLELGFILLYAIPATSVLGAILVSAYLGGAVVTHLRVGENGNVVAPILLGVFAWAGLFLRDARLRALLPLRAKND